MREVLDMEALEARQLAMDSDPRVTGTREGNTANTIDQVSIFLVLPLSTPFFAPYSSQAPSPAPVFAPTLTFAHALAPIV